MAKLHVFTLNFAAKNLLELHNISQESSLPHYLYSHKNEFGFFQFFQSENFFLESDEPLQVNSFVRSFFTFQQVDFAFVNGCPEIKKFFYFLKDLSAKEPVEVLCRIMIHGMLGSDHGFAMEDLSNTPMRLLPVSTDRVAQIVASSFSHSINIFTPQSPLRIQLMSCSAGSSVDYFQIEKRLLAAQLAISFLSQNIFVKIEAFTTTVSLPVSYYYLAMSGKKILTRHGESYVSVFGECFNRRGISAAIQHIENHIINEDEKKNFEKVKSYIFFKTTGLGRLNLSKSISCRKIGYQLLYTMNADRTLSVTDRVTGQSFIHEDDLKLEAHRDLILQYFWMGVLYGLYAQIDRKFLTYCICENVDDLFVFIEKIEEATSREEFLEILKQCNKIFYAQKDFLYKVSRILNQIAHFSYFYNSFEDCQIKKWNLKILRKNLADPLYPMRDFKDTLV